MTLSRPSRARGLKRVYPHAPQTGGEVAPLAGAWIETSLALKRLRPRRRRAPRGRVD